MPTQLKYEVGIDTQIATQYVMIEGHRIAYKATGEGRPIILIHGIPTSKLMWWRDVMPSPATQYRVIAPDVFNFGESDGRSVDNR